MSSLKFTTVLALNFLFYTAAVEQDRGYSMFCNDGDIRLRNFMSDRLGRLEVCRNQLWGNVCAYGFGVEEATVACIQLNLITTDSGVQGRPVSSLIGQLFGTGEVTDVVLSNVVCSGNEESIFDCSHQNNECHVLAAIGCPRGCNDGDVRLVDGPSSAEGYVEMCLSEEWSLVCNNFWDLTSASVACYQLGFGREAVLLSSNSFNNEGNLTVLSNIQCVGHEKRLIDCPRDGIETNNCMLGGRASVRCTGTCMSGDIRLADGYSLYDGRVEVCDNGQWGTICHHYWNQAAATVVCRQLGFSTEGSSPLFDSYYGRGHLSLLSTNRFECNGDELNLLNQCQQIQSTCTDMNVASVSCYPPGCPPLTAQSPLSIAIILVSSLTESSDYVLKSLYQCLMDGFVPVGGNALRSCSGSSNSSGQWTGSTPLDCQAVMCDSLAIDNGQVTFYNDESPPFDYLTVAVFVCNSGFELQGGNRMRTCFSDGVSLNGWWSGEQPICTRIQYPSQLEYVTTYQERYSGIDDEYVGPPISILSGLPFGNTTHYVAYVGANGVISFSKPYNFYQPMVFPSNNLRVQQSFILAPFANDLDITVNSSVSISIFDILSLDTTSVEQNILQRTSRFIQQNMNVPHFDGYWMLVVHWDSTKMFPRSAVEERGEFFSLPNDIQQSLDKENTFQAIVITNYTSSYSIFTYRCGDLNSPGFYYKSSVGINAGSSFSYNQAMSGTDDIINIACTNPSSQWNNIVYQLHMPLTQPDAEQSQVALCWLYYKQSQYKESLIPPNVFTTSIDSLPSCPCTKLQASDDVFFYSDPANEECYISRFANNLGLGLSCCYRNMSSFSSIQPFASYILYHPRLGTVDSQFEIDFRTTCCGIPTLGICDVYYSRRSLNRFCISGQSYTPPTKALSIDGHHIRTFDGVVYTFNGVGEFSLIENENIRVQIRTQPTLYHAGVTDFAGFAISLNNITARVNCFGPIGMSQVEVSQDSSPFANVSSLYIPRIVEVSSSEDNVLVVFANGLSLLLKKRSNGFFADFEVSAISSFYFGNINGLLGNFNGNTNDEYEDRYGTVYQNALDQDIYQFGLSWQVTPDDLLFDTICSDVGQNFVPLFLSDTLAMADNEVLTACSSNPSASNTLCVYGVVAGTPDALERLSLYDEILSSKIHPTINFRNVPVFEILLEKGVKNCHMLFGYFEQPPNSVSLIHDVPDLFDVTNVYSQNSVSTTICVNISSTFIPSASDIPQVIFLYSVGNYEVDFAPSVIICPCGSNGYCDYSSTLEQSPSVLDCICNSLPAGNIFFPFKNDTFLPIADDIYSDAIVFPFGIPFYGQIENVSYVNINGVLDFRVGSNVYGPQLPLGSNPLIAIFYHDINIYNGGNVSYRLSNDSETIELAALYLNEVYSVADENGPIHQHFIPKLVLTVTWSVVHPYLLGSPLDSKNCTFQLALISDGNTTYTIFVYSKIQWGFRAAIGFQRNATMQFNTKYSRTDDTRNVDHFSNVGRRGVFVYRVDGPEIISPDRKTPQEPQRAFTGSSCEEEVNGCDYIACLDNAECTDIPSPGFGVLCPPCAFVNIYNGTKCEPEPIAQPTHVVFCPRNNDAEWWLLFPETPAGDTHHLRCPQNGSSAVIGLASRLCNTSGEWSEVDISNCASQDVIEVEMRAMEIFSLNVSDINPEDVDSVIENLIDVTETNVTSGSTNFARDLNTTNSIVASAIDYLIETATVETQSESDTSLELNQNLIDVFDNILDESNSEGWEDLQEDSVGSQQVLLNSENYGLYIVASLQSNRVDTGNKTEIKLTRENIELEAKQVDPKSIEDILFPLIPETTELTGSAQTIIPADLLKERGAESGNVSAVNIIFHNLESFLPTDKLEQETTTPVTQVLSTQIISDVGSGQPFNNNVRLKFTTRRFSNNEVAENPVCASWKVDEDLASSTWSTEGVTTVNIIEDSERREFTIYCESNHLTAFAVLMDVTGAINSTSVEEQFALTVVSYVGCSISIFFLIVSIIYLLTLRKELFRKVHNFVHLNLAIALLLGYTVFLAGIDTAVVNRGLCIFVAALLQYLFTAVFFWMLCEGIMIYLMLVIVFSEVAKKWWIFFIIGWVAPIVPVAISVGVITDQYGTSQYCWIAVGNGTKGAIWAFVTPILMVTLLNIFFLLAGLRSVYKQRKLKMGKTGKKQNVALFSQLFKALVILLPLLGLTWVFGLLTVNGGTLFFSWLFTIFNSLQGVFIFYFHVLSNLKLWKNFLGRFSRKKRDSITSSAAPRSSVTHHSRLSQSYSSSTVNEKQGVTNPTFHNIKDDKIEEFVAENILEENVTANVDQSSLIMVNETVFESGEESECEPTEYDSDEGKRWRRTVTFNWMNFNSENDLDAVMLAD